jgi:hypothetical protein
MQEKGTFGKIVIFIELIILATIGNGGIVCLALCESKLPFLIQFSVIKHPCTWLMPNPYYVIANEDLVMTRYFFFYPGGSTKSIYAKDIKHPEIQK